MLDEDNFSQDITVFSESRDYSYSGISNVVKVCGKELDEVDIFADQENCSITTDSSSGRSILHITQTPYPAYQDYTYAAVMMPAPNPAGMAVNINNLGNVDIIDDSTEKPLPEGSMRKDSLYLFMYLSGAFRYMGHYHPNAVAVLLSKSPDNATMKFYEECYHCDNIKYIIEKDNPYTADKIGRCYKRLSGGEYDNIQTDAEAMSSAEYFLWQTARVTNTIRIGCDIIPFLDVNQKFRYRHQKSGQVFTYITKQLSLSLSPTDAQMTITASTYNDLYPNILS